MNAIKSLIVLFISVVVGGFAWASGTETAYAPGATQLNRDHSVWNNILQKYVRYEGSVGTVDYTGLKKNHDDLKAYIDKIESIEGSEFSGWSKNEKLAFLINAYNALTINLILDNFPGIQSIRDIKGSFGFKNPTRSPWKISFFKLFMNEHTLDDIEHEMIRKKFDEPRIHFALVCASKGCPGLRNEAYTGDRLDQQLEAAANAFLRDSARNRFDSPEKTLYLSSIFKWYGEDFDKKFGSVKAFVAPKIAKTPEEEKLILGKDVNIRYLDYDWTLNGK